MLPVLEVKEVVKQYPGVLAVNRASLSLMPGEVHALVGENGAGKSTLIKIMAGVVRPDSGSLFLNGKRLELTSGLDAYRYGLSFIHQELNLIPYLNGAENIFLGRPYPTNRIGMVDWKMLYDRARQILSELGADTPVDVPVSRLSRGGQAMISIARAFAGEALIFVMDEPTASLSDEEIRHLFQVIGQLKSRGKTVLYVSHRLNEIFEISDRVTVMRDGSVIGTFAIQQVTQADLIRSMIGRELNESIPPSHSKPGEIILEVQNLKGGIVQGVSFEVREGEIVALAGLVGAGRSEVLHMLYGAAQPEGGEIRLFGRRFQPRSPADAIRAGIALVPEERRTQGLILNRAICENISLPFLRTFTSATFLLNGALETAAAQAVSRQVNLKAVSLKQKAAQLSGGNQQKVVFARWLMKRPRLLLLDEPTRGVDVGARFEIYRIIRELAADGMGVVLVSSDLSEVLGLADRIIVLREGRQISEINALQASQEIVLHDCYGGRK